jgi:uncharacterized protein YhaN
MRIERLDLIAFGQFADRSIEFPHTNRPFHLVYGPNESGKSTCLRAIRGLFFGIPVQTRDNYRHDGKLLRIGAKLVDQHGQSLTVIRRKNGQHKLRGEDDQTPIEESRLSEMLGGIDEETFLNRFGLSHDQLVRGGKLVLESKGELGEVLFAAGAGISRLKAIESAFDKECKALFLPTGKKPTINALLGELKKKRSELREKQSLPAEYQQLVERIDDARTRETELRKQLTETTRQLHDFESLRDAITIVPVWRKAQSRLAALESVPLLSENFGQRRFAALTKRSAEQKNIESLSEDLKTIAHEIETLELNPAILDHEHEIVARFQEIATQHQDSVRRSGLEQQIREHDQTLTTLLRDLGVPIEGSTESETIDQQIERLRFSDAVQTRITELSSEHPVLCKTQHDAKIEFETLQRTLESLQDQLEQTPPPMNPNLIETVLSDLGPAKSLLQTADQQSDECKELEKECGNLLVELQLEAIEIDQAVALHPPEPDTVEQHEGRLNELRQQRDELQTKLTQLREQRDSAEKQLREFQSDLPLPDHDELTRARLSRDETIDQIAQTADDPISVVKATDRVRKSVRHADEMVDTMRSHHRRIAERDRTTQDLAELEHAITDCEDRLTLAGSKLSQAESAWETLLDRARIPFMSPAKLKLWCLTHKALREKHDGLERLREKLCETENRIESHKHRLATTVKQAWSSRPVAAGQNLSLDEVTDTNNLEALHDLANQLKSELDESLQAYQELNRRIDQAETQLPQAEVRFNTATRELENWESKWKQLTASLGDDSDLSPAVVAARLKSIEKLLQEQQRRNEKRHAIREIDRQAELFQSGVRSLVGLVDIKPSSSESPEETAKRLYATLQRAREADKDHTRLRAEQTTKQKKLEAARDAFRQADEELQSLCREANVSDVDALPELESRSSEKRSETQNLRSAEQQLERIARGKTIEAFAELVEAQEHDELDHTIAQQQERQAELEKQSRQQNQIIGGLEKELQAIDGSDQAAELNQSLQFLTGKIEREAQRYARLKIAAMILQRAIDHYRQQNESPVLQLACDAFAELTCGRYNGLAPEYDEKGRSKLFGTRILESGQTDWVPAEAMSDGTADAVFLAMRLASLQHQLASGRPIPVVIDDCLIQLDDERAAAAMKRLSKLSEQTQVILFTHHEHLADVARNALENGQYQWHDLRDG